MMLTLEMLSERDGSLNFEMSSNHKRIEKCKPHAKFDLKYISVTNGAYQVVQAFSLSSYSHIQKSWSVAKVVEFSEECSWKSYMTTCIRLKPICSTCYSKAIFAITHIPFHLRSNPRETILFL